MKSRIFLCDIIFSQSQLVSNSTSNHMFGRMIWDKLPSCIFENFEIDLVKWGQFQNFQKSDQRKKITCFHLSAWVRFFFLTMRLVNVFQNNKWIKKILNRKRKLKKKKKWDQLKKKNACWFFFLGFLYLHV